MKLTAKRKHVLTAITAYECYKPCVALTLLLFILLDTVALFMMKSFAKLPMGAFIVFLILLIAVLAIGAVKIRYMLKGLVAGNKMYVSVSDCYLQVEEVSGIFICRQVTSGGEIQYMEIHKDDIDWVLPDKVPGFYVRLKDSCELGERSDISTGKKIAYILGTAYSIDEFTKLYQAVAHGVEERNAGREINWSLPDKGKELRRCLMVLFLYCVPVLWGFLCLYTTISVALVTYSVMGVIVFFARRKHETV